MQPLISAAGLAAAMESVDPPVVIDVRWRLAGPPGLADYEQGHIPGARFVDLDDQLSDPPGHGGRHPLPAPARFAAAMREAGVSAESAVVVYDSPDAGPAARLWWLLRHFGHRRVQVLDGGFRAWAGAGLPVEKEIPPPRFGTFVATPGGMPEVDAAGAAILARAGRLVDGRAPERYRGDVEPVDPVAGHVPGAANVPASVLVDAAGRLLPGEVLLRLFADAGVPLRMEMPAGTPHDSIAAYCGSGVTAAQVVLALETVGISAALYAGSWSEWIADPARPVALGEEPGN